VDADAHHACCVQRYLFREVKVCSTASVRASDVDQRVSDLVTHNHTPTCRALQGSAEPYRGSAPNTALVWHASAQRVSHQSA
jgi:hypothetical protein